MIYFRIFIYYLTSTNHHWLFIIYYILCIPYFVVCLMCHSLCISFVIHYSLLIISYVSFIRLIMYYILSSWMNYHGKYVSSIVFIVSSTIICDLSFTIYGVVCITDLFALNYIIMYSVLLFMFAPVTHCLLLITCWTLLVFINYSFLTI